MNTTLYDGTVKPSFRGTFFSLRHQNSISPTHTLLLRRGVYAYWQLFPASSQESATALPCGETEIISTERPVQQLLTVHGRYRTEEGKKHSKRRKALDAPLLIILIIIYIADYNKNNVILLWWGLVASIGPSSRIIRFVNFDCFQTGKYSILGTCICIWCFMFH